DLAEAVAESYPTNPPPIRGDAPTLVLGRLKSSTNLSYNLSGSVSGRDMQVQGTETVPDPELDNFFLVGMVEQWKNSKDQPALTRADRALADAHTRSLFARDELIAQAELAMGNDKLDTAKTLFEQAKRLDPNDMEAKGGLKIIDALKGGFIKKDELKAQLAKEDKSGILALAQEAVQPAQPQPKDGATPEPKDQLQEQKNRMAVEEQRLSQAVDEARRQASRQLAVDPDNAHEILKRTYELVRTNPDLSDRARQ